MKYISHAIRGEISKVADESFDCLMCGLCASKCQAKIVKYKVALLCRRLNGKYLLPKADHLREKINQIDNGAYDQQLDELVQADKETLARKYNTREIE